MGVVDVVVEGRTTDPYHPFLSHWPMVQPNFHQQGTAARTAPTARTPKRVRGMASPGWLAWHCVGRSVLGVVGIWGCRWLQMAFRAEHPPGVTPKILVQAPARVTNQRAE